MSLLLSDLHTERRDRIAACPFVEASLDHAKRPELALAVQLGKAFGAEVAGVCSTTNCRRVLAGPAGSFPSGILVATSAVKSAL